MSFTAVRDYFRVRMDSLDHKEHKDGFNFENIPETIQDRAYHIESGPYTGNSQDQTVLDANADVTIRLFLLGFRDPAAAIDSGISLGEAAVCDIIDPKNANGVTAGIKNVNFLSMQLLPRDASNDNSVIVEMSFTVRTFLNTVS